MVRVRRVSVSIHPLMPPLRLRRAVLSRHEAWLLQQEPEAHEICVILSREVINPPPSALFGLERRDRSALEMMGDRHAPARTHARLHTLFASHVHCL